MENYNENFSRNISINNNNSMTIDIKSIFSNIKTRNDARWFCQINSKTLIFLDLFLPDFKCFDLDFLLMYGSNKKSVRFFYNKLLTFIEFCPVFLPNYKTHDYTKKSNLLKICREDNFLKTYLPDKDNLSEISRDFLLAVRQV